MSIDTAEFYHSVQTEEQHTISERRYCDLPRSLACILLSMTLLFSLMGCVISKPEDPLYRLQDAYNKRDFSAMIECFDPDAQRFMKGAASLLGGAFGINTSALMDMMPFLSKSLGDSGALDESFDYGTVKFTDIRTQQSGDSATLTYTATIAYPNGTTESFQQTAEVVKVDGKWYLAAY